MFALWDCASLPHPVPSSLGPGQPVTAPQWEPRPDNRGSHVGTPAHSTLCSPLWFLPPKHSLRSVLGWQKDLLEVFGHLPSPNTQPSVGFGDEGLTSALGPNVVYLPQMKSSLLCLRFVPDFRQPVSRV